MSENTLPLKFVHPVRYQWPGTGKKCECSGWGYRACPSLKHWTRYKHSCHRRDCPTHWRDWLREESGRAAYRVNQANEKIWQHVVVSLGPNWVLPGDSDVRKQENERVRWILGFVGFRGGAVVAHAARAHTADEAHAGDSSGHYHALVTGWCDRERVVGLNEQYGIVVIAYGHDRMRPYKRFEYMLSHAALPYINPAHREGSTALHAITYWGILSYNKLKVPEFTPELYCPGCDSWHPVGAWHELRLLDDPPPGEWGDLASVSKRWCEPVASWGDW